MSATRMLLLYVSCLIIFLILDLLWLYVMVDTFYRQRLDHLLAPEASLMPAFAFYVLFVLGNVVFVVLPSLQTQSLPSLFLRGALFGMVSYGTYDLTNQATLTNWPWSVTFVDLAWGMVLSTVVGYAGFTIAPYLPGS